MKTFFNWVIQLISCNLYKLNEIVNEQTIKLEIIMVLLSMASRKITLAEKERGEEKEGPYRAIQTKTK